MPQSAKGEFLVAESNDLKLPNGQPLLIARSYDGNAWENVPNLDFKLPRIECTEDDLCLMYDAGNYTIRNLDVPQRLRDISESPLHLAARLHMQATFGANKAELTRVADFYGTDYSSWIIDQMQARPTFTRSYFRARANSRPGRNGSPDGVTQPCDIGSRWHRFVFEKRDRDKNLVISLNSGASRFALSIDGYQRGEVTTFLGEPYPASATGYSFPATLRICAVEETVGGAVRLSTNLGSCDSPNVEWTNPAIEHAPSSALQTLSESEAQLIPVIGARPGAFILKWRTVACTNASDAVGNAFISVGGQTFRFDKRIRYVSNMVDRPIETGLTDKCPILVRTNYQNRDSCVRRVACGSLLSFKSALFTLNEKILRAW